MFVLGSVIFFALYLVIFRTFPLLEPSQGYCFYRNYQLNIQFPVFFFFFPNNVKSVH